MEANDDVAKTEKDSAAASELAVDAKLGGLLNSLSGQVSTAFSQLGELHAELCAHRKATIEREHELERQNDQIQRESAELEQLRASVSRSGEELARREMEMRRYESEVSEKREACSREIQRLDDLCRELDSRSELLGAREKAIDGFYELLGRMRAVMVETSVPAIEAAVAEIASAQWQHSSPMSESASRDASEQSVESAACDWSARSVETVSPAEEMSSAETASWVESESSMDDGSSMEMAAESEDCWESAECAAPVEADDRVEAPLPDLFSRELEPKVAAPARTPSDTPSEPAVAVEPEESSEQDAPPSIDLSDFSEEELATFGVRRRLRAYSDAFLAAEIRGERDGGKGKKKRWF